MKIWYDNFFFCPFNYTYLLRSSWAIVRNLQKMFEKCSEMFVWPLEQFRKIFRTSENGQKWCHQHTYIIKRTLHVTCSLKIWILCSRGKIWWFLPLDHKIHIFSSPCNILCISYVMDTQLVLYARDVAPDWGSLSCVQLPVLLKEKSVRVPMCASTDKPVPCIT